MNANGVSNADAARANDFDFLIGKWQILNRRLAKRLCGSDDWRKFEATLEVRPILDGLGNVDEYRAEIDGRPMVATTIRIYNPSTKNWSLYWIDNWSAELQPPTVGRFRDGRGEFFARDTFEGREILIRFVWSDISRQAARWEQAFSDDEGETWETNWTMEFRRVS